MPSISPRVGVRETSRAASSRRPDIQGLRALAVAAVVAFHANLPLAGGFLGVDVFFVISGFVITSMLRREWQRSGEVRFGTFYLRRFLRLTPALALMVTITVAGSAVLLAPHEPQTNLALTALGALLLSANVVIPRTTGGYFDAPADFNPLLHTWSLSVEEQFYLVFPALLVLGWTLARRSRGPRFAAEYLVVLLAVTSLILAVVSARGVMFPGAGTLIGFYSPVIRAWEFALGALLVLVAAVWPWRAVRLLAPLGAVGAVGLAVALASVRPSGPVPGVGDTSLAVVSTGLILLAAGDPGNWVTRALSHPAMVRVGDWSYSIYLWHWPFIVFASLAWPSVREAPLIAACLSLVPALVSYRFVEQPLRQRRPASLREVAPLVVSTLAVPLCVGGGLLLGVQNAWGSPTVRAWQESVGPMHVGLSNGCDLELPLGAQPDGTCVWNADGVESPVYLVGDSNADHFTEGFLAATSNLDRPLHVATTNACPFVDLSGVDAEPSWGNADQCRDYTQGSLAYLSDAPVGTVVISNYDGYWAGTEELLLPENIDANSLTLSDLVTGLTQTVQELQRAGHSVVLVQTVPDWLDWDPNRCSTWAVLTAGCTPQQPVSGVLARKAGPRSAIAQVAERTGAVVWDPTLTLCAGGVCAVQGPGYLRYRDRDHLSVQQASALGPELTVLLTASKPGSVPAGAQAANSR